MERQFQYNLAGRNLSITIGKVAEQANGACLLQYGDTVVLVTATASKEPREGIDFFPLSVDFEERLYSVGKIPGGFIKREGKPSDKAILTSRLIDRPIRPLFPNGYRNDVQVIATVLSVDQDCTPDIVGMIGSSVALSISDIPFNGPTASVLVGLVDGGFKINPTAEERDKSDIHLVVSGTKDAIMMVEAGANEVPEKTILEAILFAHEEIKKLCNFIEDIQEEVGKEKQDFIVFKPDDHIGEEVRAFATDKLINAIQTYEKQNREEAIDKVIEETIDNFIEKYPENEKDIVEVMEEILKEEVRRLILEEGIRPDNRKADEIRPITSEVGLLPRAHGSGLFKRGQTQVLTVATLGASSDVQIIDGISEEESKRYMHHYNFPSYSVGETRPLRGPGRREIGHGALAEKALEPLIPSEEEFPYTIRLVSEVLSSNGSTSQASVCGSTLALLDAGVPIKRPAAGIAMGLVTSDDLTEEEILTDIQGIEDFFGDMDFKVAGTEKGITAIQVDTKISGLSDNCIKQALVKARDARLYILGKIKECIPEPRKELSPYAPRVYTMSIDPEKIRDVIGAGGKTINKIIGETGVQIDIKEDGKIYVMSPDSVGADRALKMIDDLTRDVEAGEIYLGKVTRTTNFGAFVEILPGKEGLVHISKLDFTRVNKVEDVVSVGDEILVKVTDIDDQGRINLSRRDAMKKEENEKDKENKH